jgi:hypothetical protein
VPHQEHVERRAPAKPESAPAETQVEPVAAASHELDPAASLQRALRNPRTLTPTAMRRLQRTIGNRAVGALLSKREDTAATVKLPLRGMVHPLAADMAQPSVRFRVPSFAKLKAVYTDKDLKIPEKVVKDRVTELLQRMAREKRLKSKDPVATIIGKIFPGPGVIDETEFNNAVDASDRTKIYQSVIDADTNVKAPDKPALIAAIKDAADLVNKVIGDAAGLKQVFGAQDGVAKGNYAKAKTALETASKDLDKSVTTDYNLDDPEVGLGGYALNDKQTMHLLLRIAQVKDANDTKATVIHEASHLADSSVDDQVYYGNAGFFELEEAKKVANAAHYEELPRRLMGTSSFDTKTFTPGVTVGGGAVTREDKVKAATNLYLRKAWDAGVDAHMFIRGVLREGQAGNKKAFDDNKTLILEMSKLMDMTIHEQAAAKARVTTLDVTLSESVSRGVRLVGTLAAGIPFPSPVGSQTDEQLRDSIVAAAVTKYGALLNNPARDKALLDWFVAHYRSLPSV